MAGVLAVVMALLGCTAEGTAPRPAPTSPASEPVGSCGPVELDDVVGRAPAYLPVDDLSRFPHDHAVCRAWWLPGRDLVPQGLVVRGRTAWISGYDGDAPVGARYCRVLRVDLRDGGRTGLLDPVDGAVPGRDAVRCRHAGGLALDRDGLWLAETARLWLLDPRTLRVRRVWRLGERVRGSFALVDDAGRLGLGSFDRRRRGRLVWLEPAALLSSREVEVTLGHAVRTRRVPVGTQGAVWRGGAAWFAVSHTSCGVLVTPGGRRLGFLPGAEGLAVSGGRLWAVSESSSEVYQRKGGRPVVPMLVQLDLRGVGEWQETTCEPW